MIKSFYRVALVCTVFLFSTLALAAEHSKPLKIGSSMPSFSLPAVDGRTVTPETFKDAKVLAIVFTCNHCPTAQIYEERIIKLTNDFKSKGVEFLAINANHAAAVRLDEMAYTDLGDTFDEMVVRAKHKNFNFVYADDGEKQEMTEAYGPVATPHVYLFDSDRKLRFQGRIDNSERISLIKTHDTRAALEDMVAGRPVKVATTKVFGCSIKWRDKVDDNLRWLKKVAAEPVSIEQVDAAELRKIVANKASGKIRMVNVWATWCGPCVSEFDELVNTNLRFRYRDFELVSIAAHFPDEEAKVLSFLNKQHASMRNTIFADEDKYKMLEAIDPDWNGALPHTLVINEKGEVIYRETGSIDFLELRRAIIPALDNITPWGGLGDR